MKAPQIIETVTSQAMSEFIGIPRATINSWKCRGVIPAHYWPAISRMPQAKRAGVTLDILEKSGKKESGK